MGWGPKDLERVTGVADSTISAVVRRGSEITKYKEGLIKGFPPERINHNWLRDEIGAMIPAAQPLEHAGEMPTTTFVPVVGTAKMGDCGYYEEISTMGAGDGYIATYSKDQNAYALRVRGDSMAPAIRDGWYVVVEPNSTPSVGEYVLVKLKEGQRMVKELLYQRQDSIAVMSINGEKRKTIAIDEIDDHHGIQAIVAILPPSKWIPV
jgi:phage repressor protein C with HTH and peptisase S24 domain